MDNIRIILLFSLAFVLLLIYQAWVQDYGTPPPAVAQTPTTESTPAPPADTPALPVSPTGTVAPPSTGALASESSTAPIVVETDVLKVEIAPRGGTVQAAWLSQYPVTPETPEVKFQLFKASDPNFHVAQSGLHGATADPAPTHEAEYAAQSKHYQLGKDQDELVVDLTWSGASGLQVTKRYRFHRGSYLIDLEYLIDNRSPQDWKGRAYYQLQRSTPYDPDESSFVYTYKGAAYYSPEDKYEKVDFDTIAAQKLDREVTGGWVAMIQHYFISAWLPPAQQPQHFFTNHLPGPRYVIGAWTAPLTVVAGSQQTLATRLYVGPKLQNTLSSIAPGLDLTVDYGWLTVFAQPIWWVLDKLHFLVGNWGLAIILLTILIKAAFYKLSETSYKSMAHMRRVTPRLQALKDRYGDDKNRLNQAMMELYKKEKINPLGGCLPILVQIPVFIALYWVLLESVEMRQAPFALWITNLSAPDQYYILPLIMGVSMFIQQKLNPAPMDPVQAKVLMSMPFIFTVFFAFFPSGLVLYWTVNNILSIAQQWVITRKIEAMAKT